jgi:hypothetical protein
LWAFWIACGLTAVGAVAPLVLSGGSNRIGIVWAFGLAAVALGACAVLYKQGRSVVTALYFVAGLAIVYGILSLIAVPLRLAVVGTCPPEQARCALGLERPLTGEETTALGFAVGMGIVGILTGFFALVMLYRGLKASVLPSAPPARRIAPVGDAPPQAPAAQPVAAPEPVAPEAAAELDELPPPAEALELPAPTPEEATEPNVSAPPPPPAPKPRRRRTPKAPPDVPTSPTSDS